MADEAGADVFHAKITAVDESSATINRIAAMFGKLGHEADHVGHATEHMHKPHVWAALGEHVSLAREHFGELHASVGEVGASITELLPALAALGAAGSVAELFETTEHVAEAYSTLAHTATSLGLSAQSLNELHLVARLTDTSVEAMDHSMMKLNRTIGDSSAGKNKEAAALFSHLRISLHDANGQMRASADLLPELADAFEHTHSAAMRTRMAVALFGKAGAEMIPMLSEGAEAMREHQAEAAKYGFDFRPYAKGLESYNESMKKLGISTEGFTDAVGAKLAPVLQPVVDKATEWVTANRDWIATDIAGHVQELASWLEQLPVKAIGDDLTEAKDYAVEFIDALGGGTRAVEIMAGVMALKGVLFLADPIIQLGSFGVALAKSTYGIGVELVEAFGKAEVAAHAVAAAEAEVTAAGDAAVTSSARGLGALAGRFVVPLAGGLGAHEGDADDHIGRWMDRNVPGAEAVDDWAYRNTGGLVGHPRGWVEHLDSADRGRNYLANWKIFSQPAPPGSVQTPIFGLPSSDDSGSSSLDPLGSAMFSHLPTLTPIVRSAAPVKQTVEGGVDVRVDVTGLPDWANPNISASARGIANQPSVSVAQTGRAWADQYPDRGSARR